MLLKRFLLAITVIIMCFLGFRTDSSFNANQYSYQAEKKGIHFEPYSMAYTELFPDFNTEFFAIDLTISPDFPKPSRFGMILQIYTKKDSSQIAVGQWDNSLVVLGSDDFSNSRKLPKIYAPMSKDAAKIKVSIRSGSEGTSVYMNGHLIRQNARLHLAPPLKGDRTHLIIGNSIDGKTPWEGTIHSLAFYGALQDNPFLQYDFEYVDNSLIPDQSTNQIPLFLPQEVHSLNKTILRVPKLYEFEVNRIGVDIFLNFLGFMPLGFLLVVNLTGKGSCSRAYLPILSAVLLCFLFSLSIEIRQIWLPGRDSSLLDLLLNISGGLTGALLTMKTHRL